MTTQGTFENDKEINRTLLIFGYSTPHCKEHGAMMNLNGIWRCYGTYKGRAGSHLGFIERTCNCAISDKEFKSKLNILK